MSGIFLDDDVPMDAMGEFAMPHAHPRVLPMVSRRKQVLLLVVAFVIGCSIGLARIYVGVHYPDDILGGAIDGLLAALLVTVLRRWLWRPTNTVLRFAHTLRVA